MARFATVDEYVAAASDVARPALEDIRRALREALPAADEAIRYDMPTLMIEGHGVVHYAAWTRHISVYPVPDLDDDLERALTPYRSARSTAKFPLNRPVPVDLVVRLAVVLAKRHRRQKARDKTRDPAPDPARDPAPDQAPDQAPEGDAPGRSTPTG